MVPRVVNVVIMSNTIMFMIYPMGVKRRPVFGVVCVVESVAIVCMAH